VLPPSVASHLVALLVPAVLYVVLIAVVAGLAVLHPERARRGEARQVLIALLAVLRRRR